MIKPETLRCLGSKSKDSNFVGNVVRALCGQKISLTEPEKSMVAVIQNDNCMHTKSVEERRKKDAKRQADWRAKKKDENKEDVTPCHTMSHVTERDKRFVTRHSFIHSSIHSKKRECKREKETHTLTKKSFDELTDADAVTAGKAAGLADDVARQVFAELKANGGGYTSRGVFVEVTSKNLQNALRTCAPHVKRTATASNSASKIKQHTAKEIKEAEALCSERCAAFVGGKCSKGVKVLPSLQARPIPPEDCNGYESAK